MKLRGESGGVPARMGGVSGTFTPRGGSVAKRAFTRKSSAVKVVPKGSPMQNAIKNNIATARNQRAKSGLEAKYDGKQVVTGKPAATVKINSASKPKPISEAAKKANAKALKAANKKK